MSGYDIIGDIHGCAEPLEALLRKLGYQCRNGLHQHPERTAVFLGDFIDRGPEQARTLDIVRPMIEHGGALAVMGNHEFNAICYASAQEDTFVRPHTEKNTHQHSAFLREFPFGTERHRDAVAWFTTLPLYLDHEGFGVVHACWNEQIFDDLGPYLLPGNRLSPNVVHRYGQRDPVIYPAIEQILKGPEHALPPAFAFRDKDGHDRSHARLKWWTQQSLPASQRLEFGGAVLSAAELTQLDLISATAAHPVPSKPVFVGHYWLQGKPAPLSDQVACVDYSVAKGGKLAAYRWSGETKLSQDGAVICGRPRRCKGEVGLILDLSGAVICPACLCGVVGRWP